MKLYGVRTQIAGHLQHVGIKEGEIVKQGDFHAHIDDRPYRATLAQAEAASTATLGPIRFEAEFQAGKRLGRDAAIASVLGHPSPAPAPDGTAPLAKRELDVARLVADGLTNKEIGTRLFISERTVDSHVRSILNKLGFGSRAQIAAWIAAPDT